MAQPKGLRLHGKCDNKQFFDMCLRRETGPIFDKLFLSCIHIEPMDGDWNDLNIPTMAYLAWYGRFIALNLMKPVNRTPVLVGSWADLMPGINTNKMTEQQEARRIFAGAIKALLQNSVIKSVSSASAVSYEASSQEADIAQWNTVKTAHVDQIDIQHAMRILVHLAHTALPEFRVEAVSMIIHVYISILKRGLVSDRFLNKIILAISQDLKLNNIVINTDACRTFYSVFGNDITDVNIRDIITHLFNMLPANALRLRLMLRQAAGSGLTALSVTGRAITTFTDFQWGRISQIFQQEWTDFTTAVNTVGNNEWYDLRKDLGIVCSTKYKNLAYVAKELLIKVNGEVRLRSYPGWTERPGCQATLDEMIAAYELARTRNTLDNTPMPDVDIPPCVEELRKVLIANANVYV